jgi:carbohydrate kinase (thermoresistant glucokinase family)
MGSPIVVMGVSGSGKSTVGAALGQRLRVPFADADDFHPPANIEKMRRGVPLTDEDRWPWLENLHELIKRCVSANENAVLACSALKRVYRKHLRVSAEVKLVFLRGDYELILEQLRHRRGHFMDPTLLRSQFAELEEPQPDEEVPTIELGRAPHELVEEIKTKLRLTSES